MRVSWVASGAILIILAVILYMLRAAFAFLPNTILTYYWVIPTIFFLIGIIVLLFGLILPEHHRKAVYYHREPSRRTEQYVRERPPVYTKEKVVERREEPGTYQYEEREKTAGPQGQHYERGTTQYEKGSVEQTGEQQRREEHHEIREQTTQPPETYQTERRVEPTTTERHVEPTIERRTETRTEPSPARTTTTTRPLPTYETVEQQPKPTTETTTTPRTEIIEERHDEKKIKRS
jgi:hypothetical protein